MSARPGGWVPGDKYRFHLLNGDDGNRTLTVMSCSVSGNLCVKIEMDDEPGGGLHNVLLTEADRMVELGLWRRLADGSTPSPSPVESEGAATCRPCSGSGVVAGWEGEALDCSRCDGAGVAAADRGAAR